MKFVNRIAFYSLNQKISWFQITLNLFS